MRLYQCVWLGLSLVVIKDNLVMIYLIELLISVCLEDSKVSQIVREISYDVRAILYEKDEMTMLQNLKTPYENLQF